MVDVLDHDPIVPISTADGDYETEEAVGGWRDDIAPLDIVQPEGPGFTLDGHVLRWQDWRLHVALHPVDGLVLSDLRFRDGEEDRQVLYRASLSEMVVPYGDPHDGFYWRTYFDAGEYGMGRLANSLQLGCDCLGEIRYVDAVLADGAGAPREIPNAICIHEEDAGVLWKHTEVASGMAHVRRSRKLVVSFFATVGNYDYGFYWSLYQDGTIELEAKLTGIVLTRGVTPDQELGSATRVAPDLAAPHHQHLFNVRLDMAVDGFANTVHEVDLVGADEGPENPYGQAIVARSTPIRRESEGRRHIDAAAARSWKVVNPGRTNHVGEPTGYKLQPVQRADDARGARVERRAPGGLRAREPLGDPVRPRRAARGRRAPQPAPRGRRAAGVDRQGPSAGGGRRRPLAHVRRVARGADRGLAGHAGGAGRLRAAAGRLLRAQPGDAGPAEPGEGAPLRMSDATELTSAGDLVARLRSGELGSEELLDLQLDRIGRLDGELNAVVALDVEGAREAARAADAAPAEGRGPLHGLPMTIKDSYEVAGMPATCGFPHLAEHRARARCGRRRAASRGGRHPVRQDEPAAGRRRSPELQPRPRHDGQPVGPDAHARRLVRRRRRGRRGGVHAPGAGQRHRRTPSAAPRTSAASTATSRASGSSPCAATSRRCRVSCWRRRSASPGRSRAVRPTSSSRSTSWRRRRRARAATSGSRTSASPCGRTEASSARTAAASTRCAPTPTTCAAWA